MVMAVKMFQLSTITSRATRTLKQATMEITISLTQRTTHRRTFMRTVDETRFGLPKPTDATLSRRSFLKSAAAAAILARATQQALMAETKEGMPQRALGRTG